MIVLFTIPIFCSDINQSLTNTSIEDKRESFVHTQNIGLNEKYESDEKRRKKNGQEGQLSESSTTTEGEGGEKEIGKENSRKVKRTRANDAQIGKAKLIIKENVKDNININVKVKEAVSDQSKYNFKPSGIGDSWLIGADNIKNANAFKNRVSDCPPNLIIPSTLTDEKGQTKKVEIIGKWAFCACAKKEFGGQTRKLTLTKQVKVIKEYGLAYMDDLEEFILEEGSVLETIEKEGLNCIGWNTGKTESNRVTLTLPSTLSSVFDRGILYCDLFNVIIYCGSHPLSNTSDLEGSSPKDTVVKVSSEYPSGENIFGRSPDRDSQSEVTEKCSKMDGRPILKPSCNCPFTPQSLPSYLSLCLLSLFSTLLPSHSLSSRALFLNLA